MTSYFNLKSPNQSKASIKNDDVKTNSPSDSPKVSARVRTKTKQKKTSIKSIF
jgi:hypothetical protein